MLTKVEEAQKRWGGAHSAIDKWLQERQQLLVQYCQLAGLPPFEGKQSALPQFPQIRRFCESLVDYVSAGHFTVYDKLMDESDDPGARQTAEQTLYPRITETTDAALNFHDAYADSEQEHSLNGFDTRLARLGEQLEIRFELEDELIHALHHQHS